MEHFPIWLTPPWNFLGIVLMFWGMMIGLDGRRRQDTHGWAWLMGVGYVIVCAPIMAFIVMAMLDGLGRTH